ncbi:ABC transporter substrate-binding protein [Pseudomonas mucidolens]|uniref:Iron complex transport system substrate-binding protein n=1 Tax=Pseudomonas mucidolens TaxID=46679 RepID=A0A1H2NEQ2_9PSED|nr:ABC transporter substrate-binding protein [Pseudomonas mucidolens]SDV03957.1 iron complex transport system substrate-binding protein [Pseudomonas mucidolens]SQH32082.1 Periplasmic binding protein [Pseudomonas mucidolens]
MLLSMMLLSGCERMDTPVLEYYPSQVVGDKPAQNLDASCVSDFHEDVDYFPERTQFDWSDQLSVEYAGHFKRVRFRPSVNTGETLDILLVQCGTPVPEHEAATVVVHIPIRRLATGNSAMLGAADELDIVDRLVGIENARTPTVESVRRGIAAGSIQELWGYAHANIEPIMAVRPDVYLSFYSAYPQFNLHPQLQRVGVRALPQADHLEGHPLGRAEWLKFLALLVNREAKANRQFAQVEQEYLHWRNLAAQARQRPAIMAGFPSGRDSFEVFGALNQRAQLLTDAGGDYVLSGLRKHGSLLQVGFEEAYVAGAEAPVWIGVQSGHASLAQMLEITPRAAWFAAARAGQVYVFDKGSIGAWASPAHDNGMTRPHLALAELVQVLHPELLQTSVPSTFLRRLP